MCNVYMCVYICMHMLLLLFACDTFTLVVVVVGLFFFSR